MTFREGDTVMHWTHGLGQIIRVEERDLFGLKALYYAVQIRDMIIWVPSDSELKNRLRAPTPKSRFKELIAILSSPGEAFPDDRQQRRIQLLKLLKDGRTQSLCQIISGLNTYRKTKSLNESDQNILKQARSSLLAEWGFVLSITPAQAEHELHHWLGSELVEVE